MKKSETVRSLLFGVEFFTNLYKEVVELGGNEEMIYEFLKTGSKGLKETAKLVVNKTKIILKYLELINPKISVSSASFSKQEFFNSKLGVKIYTGGNFDNWIKPELSETIPAWSGNLASYKLIKNMQDSEIRPEIGEDQVFSPDEAIAIIFGNILKQSNGEAGDFENTSFANILYIRLQSGEVVSVSVSWFSVDREWHLFSNRLDDDNWRGGNRVFARS